MILDAAAVREPREIEARFKEWLIAGDPRVSVLAKFVGKDVQRSMLAYVPSGAWGLMANAPDQTGASEDAILRHWKDDLEWTVDGRRDMGLEEPLNRDHLRETARRLSVYLWLLGGAE